MSKDEITARLRKQQRMEKDVRSLLDTFSGKAKSIYVKYGLKLSSARIIDNDGDIVLDVTFIDEKGDMPAGQILGGKQEINKL